MYIVFRPLTWLKYGKVRHRQREKHSHESVKNGKRFSPKTYLETGLYAWAKRPVPSV